MKPTTVPPTPEKMIEENQRARSIQTMFNAIAPRYDLLNRLLSGGMDVLWRKAAVRKLAPQAGEAILDLATGTADLALETLSACPKAQLVGADFSVSMLELASKKIKSEESIQLVSAAAEALPFPDATFNGLTVAFGVRNYSNLDQGLSEMKRVLKPGGRAVILEFSLPRNSVLRWGYQVYFKKVLPLLGGLISGNGDAYRYLPDSVESFPVRTALKDRLHRAGFDYVEFSDMTFGIVTLYVATRDHETNLTDPE